LPGNVATDLTELLAELEDIQTLTEPIKILKAATYFRVRFECIHPFADGNGRVGRTMMNFLLMSHNHPPLIVYDEDRDIYYSALEHYNKEEDIEPLFVFFQQQLEKMWAKTIERYSEQLVENLPN